MGTTSIVNSNSAHRPLGTVLEARNLLVFRGETCVFRNLSLELELGTHTAVLGPNGAGKSTLLKLLTGEVHPVPRDRSVLRLFGLERWSVWDIRARLGVISHDLQREYLEQATGLDVILSGYCASIGVYRHQVYEPHQRGRAEQLTRQLGVARVAHRAFGSLSTGEQRRCLLGRALVHDPDVLVFDEPTSGLDPRACFRYLATMRALMARGKTAILVTHHLHEIPPEIDRVVLLKGGRVVADGPKEVIMSADRLSRLFDTPLELVIANGFYQVMPPG